MLPKTAKQAAIKQGNVPAQWATVANTGSSVGGYYFGNATTTPNIQWQGTSSGATYTAASSVLTT